MIDLVLVKHANNGNAFLFRAPRNSDIERDDLVKCDTRYGVAEGKVVSVLHDMPTDSDVYQFILQVAKATDPLKRIICKYVTRDFHYDGEDEVEPIHDPAILMADEGFPF